jgi:hypothetical protein
MPTAGRETGAIMSERTGRRTYVTNMRAAAVWVVLAVALLAAGCKGESKVTEANLSKIESGMTLSQVEAIMGGPGQEAPPLLQMPTAKGMPLPDTTNTTGRKWEDGKSTLIVTFVNGKVTNRGISSGFKR